MRPRSGSTPQLYFRPMMCIKVQCMCLSPRVKKIILWYNLWYYSSLLRRQAWDCNNQLHHYTLGTRFGNKGLYDQNNPIYKRLPFSPQGPVATPWLSFVVCNSMRLFMAIFKNTTFRERLSLSEFLQMQLYQIVTRSSHYLLRILHMPGVTHTVYMKGQYHSIMDFMLLKQHVIGKYQK